MQNVTAIGLDLAKSIFQIHAIDSAGTVVMRRAVRRSQLLEIFRRLPRSIVGLEACASAHHWAREIAALGHTVKMIPPIYVKAYVKRSKTDAADAEAICEAVMRPTMRFVPIKSADQQAAAMILKTRDLLVRQRTQTANAFRAHMSELGIITAAGMASLSKLARDYTRPRRSHRSGGGATCTSRNGRPDRCSHRTDRATRSRYPRQRQTRRDRQASVDYPGCWAAHCRDGPGRRPGCS